MTRGELPRSVRGAADPELRRLIRKRQNSESAKRCRLRRKLQAQRDVDSQFTTAQHMAHLERTVAELARRLQDTQAAVATLLARAPTAHHGLNLTLPPSFPHPAYQEQPCTPPASSHYNEGSPITTSPRSVLFIPQSPSPSPPTPPTHSKDAIEFAHINELESVIAS